MQEHLRFSLSGILQLMLICFIIMAAGRYIFIQSYAKEALASADQATLKNFVTKSVLFDLKYSALACLPALLCAVLLGARKSWCRGYVKLFPLLNLLGFLYITLLTVINYFYYQTYNNILDTFFFAFFKEEPWAVMKTLASDYPLFSGSAILIIGCILYMLGFDKIRRAWARYLPLPRKRITTGLFVLLLVALYILCMRGSLSTFPLRMLNATVSNNPLLNAAVPNGPAAMHEAHKAAKQQGKISDVRPEQLAELYGRLGIETSFPKDKATPEEVAAPLLQTTRHNEFLKQNPPDVVVAVMESMSTHLLGYDDPQSRDLYGALRESAATDFFFKNFLAEGNGTMNSLTRLLLAVPDANLSSSIYRDHKYLTNMLLPFLDQGYKTVFITGGSGSWRNLDLFMNLQGFEEFYELNYLKVRYPEATEGIWGIDDQYMWEEVLHYLRQEHTEPLLIVTLSITNHPPFRVPEGGGPQSIPLSAEELKRFSYKNTEKIFATFRYANDQLGKFISAVKADPLLAERTFIAASGDHNIRGIGYADHPEEVALGYAVPFYLYIPQKYQEQEQIVYEPQLYGSHKDIFATLIHHSLSDARFYSFGCDLLNPGGPCLFPFAFNMELAIPRKEDFACAINKDALRFDALRLQSGSLMTLPKEPLSSPRCEQARNLATLQKMLYHYEAKHSPKLDRNRITK